MINFIPAAGWGCPRIMGGKGIDLQNERCTIRFIHQERIDAAREHALDREENDRLAALFKAMGDPNRLRILWALTGEEMCVCDLAQFIGVSESAVSHQLHRLRQLHLVKNRREGPILYYQLCDRTIFTLICDTLEFIRQS